MNSQSLAIVLCVAACACSGEADHYADAASDGADDTTRPDVSANDTTTSPEADVANPLHTLTVEVTLDGVPLPGATLVQGGTDRRWETRDDGTQEVVVDFGVVGEVAVVASHHAARTKSGLVFRSSPSEAMTIELQRFAAQDNDDYSFQDPGEPDRSPTTQQCGHCHVTINDAWFNSPHRTSASNPRLQDLYTGRALSAVKPPNCASLGGTWKAGQVPGASDTAEGCYSGPGVLPALNPGCAPGTDCETTATQFGLCADCHAPGIDGKLGGRDLLDARGVAHDYGVHCDVCHKVESVDLKAPAGVAGRLRIHRPSEPASISLGGILPLQFGPNPDVPNIRMGNVPREHFHRSELCAGCHELEQPSWAGDIDLQRWPNGRLPIHSTYSEWKQSSLSPAAPCQSCHMPPDPTVANSADLQLFPDATVGITGGWYRPPGAVRSHSWIGPKTDGANMLENAAALSLNVAKVNDRWALTVTVSNIGPGHAIPTGEPMRSLVMVAEAQCDGESMDPVGGAAISHVGGAVTSKAAGADWSQWPSAKVGDIIRVTQWGAGYHDYTGYGPFGDGRFSTEEKGWRVEEVVGSSRVTAVVDGVVSVDRPLPAGDNAYLARSETDYAGLPGVDFARVLSGSDGATMVPHFAAVDVARDNRLLPQSSWTSSHSFGGPCESVPSFRATLLHLDVPAALARKKGWLRQARFMADAVQ